ncbi:hypothetical protein D3C87_1818090 [compost metagenome]
MDEEFIVLVLTDDDETVIHGRIHGFMKSEIQGIRQGPLLFARELLSRNVGVKCWHECFLGCVVQVK